MVNFVTFVIMITIFLIFTYIYIKDVLSLLVFNKLSAQKSLKVSAMMVKYQLVCSDPLSYLSRNALNSVAWLPSLKASSTRFQELKKCKQPDLGSGHITLLKNTVYKTPYGGEGSFIFLAHGVQEKLTNNTSYAVLTFFDVYNPVIITVFLKRFTFW